MLRAHHALMSLHTSVLSSLCVRSVYAVRLPLGFFLPTSVMVRPANVRLTSLAICYLLFVRTRGQTLLELLGLVGVLKDEGVDVGGASDLELDVVDLLVLLYAGGCNTVSPDLSSHSLPRSSRLSASPVHWASLRRQISMNCLMSETSEGILTICVLTGRWNSESIVKFGNAILLWTLAPGRPRLKSTGYKGAGRKRCCFGLGGVTTCVA